MYNILGVYELLMTPQCRGRKGHLTWRQAPIVLGALCDTELLTLQCSPGALFDNSINCVPKPYQLVLFKNIIISGSINKQLCIVSRADTKGLLYLDCYNSSWPYQLHRIAS